MKKILFIAFLAILSSTPAYADHGWGWGWRDGWIAPALVGSAIAYDLAYPRTIYVQPYPVYAQPYAVYEPPVYVQPAQSYDPSVTASAVPYWYFCTASNAYYPYVSSCPGGWKTVPTTPPTNLPGTPNSAPAR